MLRSSIAALFIVGHGVALAQPASAPDAAEADLAFQEGQQLRTQGKWDEACAKFQASYSLGQRVGSLLSLADCDEHRARLATSWAEYRDVVDRATAELASRPDDKIAAAQRDHATQAITQLVARMPKLHLTLPAQRPLGFRVERDGLDVTQLADTDTFLDLQHHRVVVSAPGMQPQSFDVDVREEARTYSITVAPLQPLPSEPEKAPEPPTPSAAPPAQLPPSPAAAAPEATTTHASPWSYVVAGAGGAALIVGLGFGLEAHSQYDRAHDNSHCDANNACDAYGYGLVNDAYSSARVSTAFVVSGAAAVIAGAVMWAVWRTPDERAAVTIAPSIGLHAIGLSVGGAL